MIILAPYVWDTTSRAMPHWRGPGPGVDLRSLTQCGRFGGAAEGHGLFELPDDSVLPKGALIAGRSLSDQADLDAFRQAFKFGAEFQATTVGEALRLMLTLHSDPTGRDRVRTIKPTHEGHIPVPGGSAGYFSIAEAERTIINAAIREDYREVAESVQRGEVADVRLAGKYLESMRRKLRMSEAKARGQIVPSALAREARFTTPETTKGDTFVEGSDTALASHTSSGPNGGDAWTVLAGTHTVRGANDDLRVPDNGEGLARLDGDVSSSDNYVELDVLRFGNGNIALAGRIASGATPNLYLFDSTFGNTCELYKRITGTYTSIGGPVARTVSNNTFYTNRLTMNGSGITCTFSGTDVISITNGDIGAGTRGGPRTFNSGGSVCFFDNLVVTDLVAAGRKNFLTLLGAS